MLPLCFFPCTTSVFPSILHPASVYYFIRFSLLLSFYFLSSFIFFFLHTIFLHTSFVRPFALHTASAFPAIPAMPAIPASLFPASYCICISFFILHLYFLLHIASVFPASCDLKAFRTRVRQFLSNQIQSSFFRSNSCLLFPGAAIDGLVSS